MLPFRSPINDVPYTSIVDVYTLQSVIFNSVCHDQISVDEWSLTKNQDARLEQRVRQALGQRTFAKSFFPLDLAVARPDLNLLRTMKNE